MSAFISRHNNNIYIKINVDVIKDLFLICLYLILASLVILVIPAKVLLICLYIYHTKYYNIKHDRLEDSEAARLLKKYSSKG